jgi:hypothetical protein
MPPELKTASSAPDVLLAVEGVSLKISGRSIAEGIAAIARHWA